MMLLPPPTVTGTLACWYPPVYPFTPVLSLGEPLPFLPHTPLPPPSMAEDIPPNLSSVAIYGHPIPSTSQWSPNQFSDAVEEQKYDLIASFGRENLLLGCQLGHAAAIETLSIRSQDSASIHITQHPGSVGYISDWLRLFKREFTEPVSKALCHLEERPYAEGEPVRSNQSMCFLASIVPQVSFIGVNGNRMTRTEADITEAYSPTKLLPNWHLKIVASLLPEDRVHGGVSSNHLHNTELSASTAAIAADVLLICWLLKQNLFDPQQYTYDLPGFLVEAQPWDEVVKLPQSPWFRACLSLEGIQIMIKELNWLPDQPYIPKDAYGFLQPQ
eukprot:TRINITY_DN5427_c0_g1_i1.p1 TRINITY_DN5427_c0_g1~~TRINITY_DN5427_c0_g1_i1.p1  ORF type:complete len:374 (-),score=0.58 TRINITY_DN5427_c0_g1_i1:100-1089(-)